MEPFHNNPTKKSCKSCKSKDICLLTGGCLLKASKEFAEEYKDLLLFGIKDEDRSRFDKRRKKRELPQDLGGTSGKPKSPAGNTGKVKPFIQRYKRDNKGNIVQKQRGTTPSGQKIDGVKGKAPVIEKINTLPDKITKQKSKIQKKIAKENAKIANLTANEAERGKVTVFKKSGKQLSRGKADMDIKSNKKFAKKQGVVLAQVDDPKKLQQPPRLPTKVGVHNRRESKIRERKELDKNPKTRARKKKLEDLDDKQLNKIVNETMRRKKLNKRGALSYLRKNPLVKVFLRR